MNFADMTPAQQRYFAACFMGYHAKDETTRQTFFNMRTDEAVKMTGAEHAAAHEAFRATRAFA